MTSGAVPEGEIAVAGVRVPLLEGGPAGTEEAVVFVHGNPGSSRDWQDLLPRVGEFARAVAIDMPGFGRADKPPDFDYSVDGYARFLAGVLSVTPFEDDDARKRHRGSGSTQGSARFSACAFPLSDQ